MGGAARRPRTADGSPQGWLRNVPPPYERWPRASGGPERAGKGAETTQPAPRMNRAGEDVGAGSGETATPHRSKSKQARLRQVGRLVQCRQNRRGRTAVTWPLLMSAQGNQAPRPAAHAASSRSGKGYGKRIDLRARSLPRKAALRTTHRLHCDLCTTVRGEWHEHPQ